MKITDLSVENLPKAPGPARYVVKHQGKLVGFLEKGRNTRSAIHPWKAYAAEGCAFGRYLGAHYGSRDLALGFIIDELSNL